MKCKSALIEKSEDIGRQFGRPDDQFSDKDTLRVKQCPSSQDRTHTDPLVRLEHFASSVLSLEEWGAYNLLLCIDERVNFKNRVWLPIIYFSVTTP